MEIVSAVVKQDNAQCSAIVAINNAGADIDKILHSQPGAGSHTPVVALRNGHSRISMDNDLAVAGYLVKEALH